MVVLTCRQSTWEANYNQKFAWWGWNVTYMIWLYNGVYLRESHVSISTIRLYPLPSHASPQARHTPSYTVLKKYSLTEFSFIQKYLLSINHMSGIGDKKNDQRRPKSSSWWTLHSRKSFWLTAKLSKINSKKQTYVHMYIAIVFLH